jgi:DNA-directed RNA polymerase specialized sigma24 family protein
MDDWPDFKSVVDLPDHYKRLLLAAQGRLRRSWWGGASQKQAADFVHDAFQKAMSGQRNWDRTRSLYQNLWQIVSSEISHAAESYENKNSDHIDETVVQIKDYRDTPEETTIKKTQVEHILTYLRSRDVEAAAVGELILKKGVTQSLEIGVQLERTTREIDNIKKRLRRLCNAYQEEQLKRSSDLRHSKPKSLKCHAVEI